MVIERGILYLWTAANSARATVEWQLRRSSGDAPIFTIKERHRPFNAARHRKFAGDTLFPRGRRAAMVTNCDFGRNRSRLCDQPSGSA
jgi:hypothetical protein